jgi:transposase-like protein
MNCPHRHSAQTTTQQRTTELGYAVYRSQNCGRTFNECTGTLFNTLGLSTDIVFQVLLCRVRYKHSYRDVAELFLMRGFAFTRKIVRDWEERFLSIFADELRAKRNGNMGNVWHEDETYIKVKDQWCYVPAGH